MIGRMFLPKPEIGRCFKWPVEAASIFLYANRTGKDPLLVRARSLYSLALKATNSTISDPPESLKDETFCAILVLNVIDVGADSSESIRNHIDQAAG